MEVEQFLPIYKAKWVMNSFAPKFHVLEYDVILVEVSVICSISLRVKIIFNSRCRSLKEGITVGKVIRLVLYLNSRICIV